MDAGEFERVFYTILSEESFRNQRFHMKEEMDDYTISDYVSQHFGMLIGETMICLTYHQNNPPKVLLIYFSIGRNFTQKEKLRPISHKKMTHLAKSCVTMNGLVVEFYDKLS